MSGQNDKKLPDRKDKDKRPGRDTGRSIQDQKRKREKFERPQPWPPPPKEKDSD